MTAKIKYNKGDKIKNCTFLNDENNGKYGRVAKFRCYCGNEFITSIALLKNGKKYSCGCAYKATRGMTSYIHGHAAGKETPEYKSWVNMKTRCTNENNEFYDDYGGRGITVCDEWLNSFEAFLEDMGKRPSNTTLDRIDNNKGYYKENCRWGTKKQQSNNRRNNILITYKGEAKTIKQWADALGLRYKTIHKRFHLYKWPVEKTFEKPFKLQKVS